MRITAPLTVRRLEHAACGIDAQISKRDLRTYIGEEMLPNASPMLALVDSQPHVEFVSLMQEPMRPPRTRYRFTTAGTTMWATHNPEGFPSHRWTYQFDEPRDDEVNDQTLLITPDLETMITALERCSGQVESRLASVVKRIAQLYVVDRYELVAHDGLVVLTLVAKDDGGLFTCRLDQ